MANEFVLSEANTAFTLLDDTTTSPHAEASSARGTIAL